jgi:N-methylhydantoinase A
MHRFAAVAECRYVGQGFELRAAMPDGPLDEGNVGSIIKNFFDVHKQVYGHAFEDQLVEIITLRVVGSAATEMLKLPELAHGGRSNPRAAELYTRNTVFDDGKAVPTPRYDRAKLLADDVVSGPALIVQHNSTTLVPPGYSASVLSHGDMRIARVG